MAAFLCVDGAISGSTMTKAPRWSRVDDYRWPRHLPCGANESKLAVLQKYEILECHSGVNRQPIDQTTDLYGSPTGPKSLPDVGILPVRCRDALKSDY